MCVMFFFVNDTATTEIYTYLHTLSLHDALPIYQLGRDTEILQVVADIVDELEIGIAARGVEGDQALDHRTGSGPDGRRVGVQGSGHVERVLQTLAGRIQGSRSDCRPRPRMPVQ